VSTKSQRRHRSPAFDKKRQLRRFLAVNAVRDLASQTGVLTSKSDEDIRGCNLLRSVKNERYQQSRRIRRRHDGRNRQVTQQLAFEGDAQNAFHLSAKLQRFAVRHFASGRDWHAARIAPIVLAPVGTKCSWRHPRKSSFGHDELDTAIPAYVRAAPESITRTTSESNEKLRIETSHLNEAFSFSDCSPSDKTRLTRPNLNEALCIPSAKKVV